MKCAMMFLVLTLVVLMAEPGEAFFHHLVNAVGSLFGKKEYEAMKAMEAMEAMEAQQAMKAQEAMEQRAVQRENNFA